MKKLNEIKQNEIFVLKFEIFSVKIISPHAIQSTEREISFLVTNQFRQISFVQPIWNDL